MITKQRKLLSTDNKTQTKTNINKWKRQLWNMGKYIYLSKTIIANHREYEFRNSCSVLLHEMFLFSGVQGL